VGAAERAGEYAWCIACRGTGLQDHACEGCGEPTTLSTIDRAALACVGIVIHADCDTGHSFFEHRPTPVLWV